MLIMYINNKNYLHIYNVVFPKKCTIVNFDQTFFQENV